MGDSVFKKSIAKFFFKLGFTANALTLLGLGTAGLAGWFCYEGLFFQASAALLISGLLDMMDGAVARLSGKAGKFGGILDSTLDRYGDAFVLAGLLFFSARTGREFYALLSFAAMVGSFAISYVRARAECEIETCRVGFWERGERVGLLVIALAVKNPGAALWILAVVTQWTTLERLLESHRRTRDETSAPTLNLGIRLAERRSAAYAVKVFFWVSLLCVWRPLF